MNPSELTETEEDQVKYHRLHFDLQTVYLFIGKEIKELKEFRQNILDDQFTFSQCIDRYDEIRNNTNKDIQMIWKSVLDNYLNYQKKCQGKGSDN